MRDTSYLRQKKSVKTQCSRAKQTGFDDRLGASLLSHCTEGSCCVPSVAPCVFVSFMLQRKETFHHTSSSQTGYFNHFYGSDIWPIVLSYPTLYLLCFVTHVLTWTPSTLYTLSMYSGTRSWGSSLRCRIGLWLPCWRQCNLRGLVARSKRTKTKSSQTAARV